MTETIEYCVRACVRRRYHATDCEDPETCRGCEPRLAKFGHLCEPCHRRFRLMLDQAEITERWLNGNLVDGVKAQAGKDDAQARGTLKAPPAPLSVAILDARDQLADRLAVWVDDLCADRKLTGPRRHGVAEDSNFLLMWLSTVEHLTWIGDWFEELAETLSDAHMVAPWRPAMNRLQGIPCPECHHQALAIFGGESDVTCLECRNQMPPERYGIWTRVLADEHAS